MKPWYEFKRVADACCEAVEGSDALDAAACALLFPPGQPYRPLTRSLDAGRAAAREILIGWDRSSDDYMIHARASVSNRAPRYEGIGSRPNPARRFHETEAATEELAFCAALLMAVADLDAPYVTNPDEKLYRVDLRVRLAYVETSPLVSHIVYFSACHPSVISGMDLSSIGCEVVEAAFDKFVTDKAEPETIIRPTQVANEHRSYPLLGAPPEGSMTVGQWLSRRYP